MPKSKLTKAGGSRPSAGRKKGEPTQPLNKRVPSKYKQHIIKLIDAELKRLKDLEASKNGI